MGSWVDSDDETQEEKYIWGRGESFTFEMLMRQPDVGNTSEHGKKIIFFNF